MTNLTLKTLLISSLLFATASNFFLTLCRSFQSQPVTVQTEGQKNKSPFVTVHFMGQLGNMLFQAAAAHALAWDNGSKPILPSTIPEMLRAHVFSKCCCKTIGFKRIQHNWEEPFFHFVPIQYQPNMKITGYFQSERYFKKYRKRLLTLFAPLPEDKAYIEKKYHKIIAHPNSVGVQLRYYHREQRPGVTPQYGKDFLTKAMSHFPEDTLFVISSDNIPYAKSCIPTTIKNILFLEGEPNYIDMYILSMCTHNIISNSSFGWWAAWLNKNPNKKVLCPKTIFFKQSCQDYYPPEWIRIEADYN